MSFSVPFCKLLSTFLRLSGNHTCSLQSEEPYKLLLQVTIPCVCAASAETTGFQGTLVSPFTITVNPPLLTKENKME